MTSVWVYTSENHGSSIEVPVTPETTVHNILECVLDPVRGEGYLVAVAGDTEYILQEGDNAYNFLYDVWRSKGTTANFLLRYCSQQAEWPPPELEARRHQVRCSRDFTSESFQVADGGMGDMTFLELQDMASRQQQMIESQQQALLAKEQRLKYLKQQESKQAQLASESERLRKMRERVENQEMKLRKLRALRGQAEQYRVNNGNLNSELEAVRTLFSQKEKELAAAVNRVEQLTRQLRELKTGASGPGVHSQKMAASNAELEKLKKELLMRNQLNEQQTNTIAVKEKLLKDRREKVALVDARIQELQQRLKKRQLQEQQAGGQGNKVSRYTDHQGVITHTQVGTTSKQEPKYQILPSEVKYDSSVLSKDNFSKPQMGNFHEQNDEYKLPVVLPSNNIKDINENLAKQGSGISQRPQPHTRSSRLGSADDRVTGNQNNANIAKLSQPSYSVTELANGAPTFLPSAKRTNAQQNRQHLSLSNAGGRTGQATPGTYVSSVDQPSATSSSLTLTTSSSSTPSSHPVISISDEERQAGSGQSSPASTESSSNVGMGAQNGFENEVNTSPIGPVSAMIEKLNRNVVHSHGQGQTQQNVTNLKGTNSSQKTHLTGQDMVDISRMPPSLPSTPPRSNLNTQAEVFSRLPPSLVDEVDSSKPSPNVDSPRRLSSAGSNSLTSLGSIPVSDQTSPSLTSGPHLNQKPALPYRYASKNTIANTYMGRLGSAAMERYQKSMNLLYKNADSGGSRNIAGGLEEDTTSFVQPPSSGSAPSSQDHPQFGAGISSPSYPDIASDKGSFKLHTPKQVRRRHSDSENEDLNKALQEQEEREKQQKQQSHQHPSTQHSTPNETSTDFKAEDIEPTSPPSDKTNQLTEKVLAQTNQQTPTSVEKGPETSTTTVPSDTQKSDTNTNASPSPVTKSAPSAKTEVVLRRSKSNLKKEGSRRSNNRVSFDPLALLLDASLEGELDLVKKVALQVDDVSTPNDEGITALHNAICAGHYDIVTVLVEFGCDVNAPDSDGWTPLHCAASCNNLPMVRFLVEHGACVFATTISDHETAADKCEEDEDGYDSCSDYLYSIQEKMGVANSGEVYAVFDYQATNLDELSFQSGSKLTVLRKGDEKEKEWWWARLNGQEGYVPRNLLGLFPRVVSQAREVSDC